MLTSKDTRKSSSTFSDKIPLQKTAFWITCNKTLLSISNKVSKIILKENNAEMVASYAANLTALFKACTSVCLRLGWLCSDTSSNSSLVQLELSRFFCLATLIHFWLNESRDPLRSFARKHPFGGKYALRPSAPTGSFRSKLSPRRDHQARFLSSRRPEKHFLANLQIFGTFYSDSDSTANFEVLEAHC